MTTYTRKPITVNAFVVPKTNAGNPPSLPSWLVSHIMAGKLVVDKSGFGYGLGNNQSALIEPGSVIVEPVHGGNFTLVAARTFRDEYTQDPEPARKGD